MSDVVTTRAPDADEAASGGLLDLPLDLLYKCIGLALWHEPAACEQAIAGCIQTMQTWLDEELEANASYFEANIHRWAGWVLLNRMARFNKIQESTRSAAEEMLCEMLASKFVPILPRGVCHVFEAVAADVKRQLPAQCAILQQRLKEKTPGHDFKALPLAMVRRLTRVDCLQQIVSTEYMHLYLTPEFVRLQRLFVGLRNAVAASEQRRARAHKKRQWLEGPFIVAAVGSPPTPRASPQLRARARAFVQACDDAGPCFVMLKRLALAQLVSQATWFATALAP